MHNDEWKKWSDLFCGKKMNSTKARQNKPKKNKSSKIEAGGFRFEFLKPMYWGTWFGVLFLFVMMFVPAFIVDAMANVFGDLIRRVNKKRKNIARKNIDLCFPEKTESEKAQMLKDCFRHQARIVLYQGFLWWAPRPLLRKRIVFKGREHVENALKNNRSVIFMAAHSLALDAAVSGVALAYPSSGTYKPMKNKLVDWFMLKGRSRHKGVIYAREAGFRPIIKHVREGSLMFYLPDEDLGRDNSIFVPFFGVEKATIPLLGRLSKTCKADVFPCMVCYEKATHRYVINILPALENFPSNDDYADTLAMNKGLEAVIRLCPSQYFWTMKLFKTRADGSKDFYSNSRLSR